MTRIFISGPISGDQFYRTKFSAAESALNEVGYLLVENPATIQGTKGWTWAQWMKESLRLLLYCDSVALLPGWQYSRGAQVEKALADELGLDVRLLDEWILGMRYDVEVLK